MFTELLHKKINQLYLGWFFVLLLTGNILFFHSVVIGVFDSLGFFIIFSVILSHLINHISHGKKLLSFIILFTSIIIFCLFFVYFFTLTKLVIIISIWVISIIITVLQIIKKNNTSSIEYGQLKTELPLIVFNKIQIIFPLALLLCLIQILTLFKIKLSGPIYYGFVSNPSPLTPYILGGVFLILFISIYSSIRSRYLLLVLVIFFIVSASVFIIISQNLYGADSWRHFAIEKYIASGNRYEPTNVVELLQFKSEKIPNASLYTTIPVLYHLTYLPIEYIHKFFQLLFLAPLLLLVFYFGMLDLIKSKQQSFLFVLVLLLSQGLLYVGQYNSVQAVGIVFFFINFWIWLRYLMGKTKGLPIYYWIISIFAILSYPTTGYFSLITIIIILVLKFFQIRNYIFKPLLYGIPIGLVFALPIPLLDILLKKIPVDSVYTQNWAHFFSIISDWWKTMFPTGTNNPGLFPFISIMMIFGFIWLYKHEKNRLFPLLLVLFISLQISQWSSLIFQKDRLGIFTGRVQVLLSIFYYIVAFVSLRVLVLKVIKSDKKLLFVTIGTALTLLFILLTNIAKYNFAWSISDNELNAIRYIQRVEGDDSKYIVLTDEVTAAAGTALTGFDKGTYYWYPEGNIYNSYIELLKSPNKHTLQTICRKFEIDHVYYIDTPIPLTTSFPDAKKIFPNIMQISWSADKVKVMSYFCAKKL